MTPLTLDFDRVETTRLDRLDETLIPALELIATHFANLTDDEDVIAWAARQQGFDGKEAAAIHRSNKSDDVRLLIEKALEEAQELRALYTRADQQPVCGDCKKRPGTRKGMGGMVVCDECMTGLFRTVAGEF